jgi:putative transposase
VAVTSHRPGIVEQQSRTSRQELANAIFEWIEAFYNPIRRHSALGNLSPIDYERRHTDLATAA